MRVDSGWSKERLDDPYERQDITWGYPVASGWSKERLDDPYDGQDQQSVHLR